MVEFFEDPKKLSSGELKAIAERVVTTLKKLDTVGIKPAKSLELPEKIGYNVSFRRDGLGEAIKISLSLPALYCTYEIYQYTRDFKDLDGNIINKEGDIEVESGSWFFYGNSYGLKPEYKSVNELLTDLESLADKLKPDVWLKASWIGNYINKNGRVKVKFTNGEDYSLKADSIVALVFNGKTVYIGYKTKNVEYYQKWAANEVKGKLAHPTIYDIDICAKCGKKWYWDADEPAERCYKCGSEDRITVKRLKWEEEKATEYEWYPDAPVFKPDF